MCIYIYMYQDALEQWRRENTNRQENQSWRFKVGFACIVELQFSFCMFVGNEQHASRSRAWGKEHKKGTQDGNRHICKDSRRATLWIYQQTPG